MEIIRIPTAYLSQIRYLDSEDSEYVLKTVFALCAGEDVKVEQSLRGGLVISIYREAVQMENKSRAKSGEKRLEIDLATLTRDTVATLGRSNRATNESKVTESKVKENNVNESNLSSDEDTQSVEIVKEGYGNSEINSMLAGLKKAVGCSDFKESQVSQRRYAKNFVTLKDKIGTEEFVKRLKGVLEDGFKAKNCNKLAFLYGEIKSFITDPQVVPVEAPRKQRFFDSADYVG